MESRRRDNLLPDGSARIEYHPNVVTLTPEEFEALWNLHPDEHKTIRMYGKEGEMHRWQQSYGRSYAFSGQVAVAADTTPEIIQRFIDLANARDEEEEEEKEPSAKRARTGTGTERPRFNMALVNWYKDGEDYIGHHSDNEAQLIKGEPIVCFSFGAARKFHLRPVKKGTPPPPGTKGRDLVLEDGSMLIMGGAQGQKYFTHSLPVMKRVTERRISVTVRKFPHKRRSVYYKRASLIISDVAETLHIL